MKYQNPRKVEYNLNAWKVKLHTFCNTNFELEDIKWINDAADLLLHYLWPMTISCEWIKHTRTHTYIYIYIYILHTSIALQTYRLWERIRMILMFVVSFPKDSPLGHMWLVLRLNKATTHTYMYIYICAYIHTLSEIMQKWISLDS